MQSRKVECEVIGIDEMTAFKKAMDGVNAQRHCMRVSDYRWQQMKRRARASNRPYPEALKSELDRLGVFDDYEDRFLDLFKKTD